MNQAIMIRLAVGLCIGLIIGLERELHHQDEPEDLQVAGVRSFALVAVIGSLGAVLSGSLGAWILGVTFLGVVAMVVVSYGLTLSPTGEFGITTELALLLTCGLGAMAGSGLIAEAIASAVVTTGLLGFKQEIHHSLLKLERREWVATLQLLVIAAVALPLLPNQNMGPWEALNPRTIGYLILLIAGISYIGYFAMRILGDRVGLLATSAIGGLVSSTAVTLSFARMARKRQGTVSVLGAGISLAAAIMAVRVLLEVSVVNTALLPLVVPSLACLALVPLVAAVFIALGARHKESAAPMDLRNPIELGSAIFFGGVLALLFLLVRAVEDWFGEAGIYLLSAISGITDVDAVSLSLAQSTQGSLSLKVGAGGILIAAMVNTVVKALMATFIGGWRLARWCASILLISLTLSGIAAIVVFGFSRV
ncbi:MgtC/SapB family protein [Lyngbya confervoides]|uniref:MgtC/SapB family protein n=1 Tax=Lyngbya confervoides BDU141951 TaxID=1574623 RepID=A0ABD4T282_9CYAN|nr:MgtC/SapB family protein [Lyngbya confervoides]MCM1982803.1 MgtC/SapB family protein [Lyngbya confervoides BDU141951]